MHCCNGMFDTVSVLHTQAGDCISVIIMEYARLGTLWVPIEVGATCYYEGLGVFSMSVN